MAIDLFAGLGGWTDGLLALGYRVIGYDIEEHEYWVPEDAGHDADGHKGTKPVAKRGWTQGCAVTLGIEGQDARPRTKLLRYPAELVIQDVLTIDGSAFKDAALIVCSPPCQEYSYMDMPWSRGKQIALALRGEDAFPEGYTGSRTIEELNALFNACFRIQREASEAAGHHIPMVVENVRGAIPWVGRSRGSFGSFHLWGDVPALMPKPVGRSATKVPSFRFDGSGGSFQSASVLETGVERDGRKQPGIAGPRPNGKGSAWFQDGAASHGSNSKARKAASAMIAKIPRPLSEWIGRCYYPPTTIAQRSEAA